MLPMSNLPITTLLYSIVTTVNDPDFLPQKLKTSEIIPHLIMTTVYVEKPKSGADVDILKVARQLQHLAHFLSQGHPIPGISLTANDLKIARVLSPVTNITSHRRHSDLEFPREWIEDDDALAIALRDWRRDVDPKQLHNTPAVKEKPAQTTYTPIEAAIADTDLEADANASFLSYSMKREAHWVAKTKELKKLRQTEQEKEIALRENLKLQHKVEALQRQSASFHRALFDPDKSIHEANLKAKVKLHADVRQLQRSLTAANTKNQSLVEKNKALESCNKSLVTENEELVKKTENLELSNFDLVTENVALDAEIKDLDSDNETLITMAQKLLDKHALSKESMKKYQETLVAENQALESSKDFLAAHNNNLSIRNAALEDTNKRLKESLDKIVTVAKDCEKTLTAERGA
ncbi:hypothetical protein FPHYL_5122 [Fusarium phyllophilum]|uniref:Uncharacterized protein n=1 Tax=Fusarium phyllophilum TaxID=47803 RepID=A0A8H5NEF6_9HYPO|nr:hypothetical protein FPHYL_5122 [Fusarium phyllophilum]